MSTPPVDRDHPLNDVLRVAAEDLLDVLVWLADDALFMRRIPAYDPAGSPEAGPEPEVAVLQACYPPHRRLPEPGQSLYRDLQGMIDLRFCDARPGPHTPPEEMVKFHKTVDRLIQWLVTYYDLGEPPPATLVTPPNSSGPPTRPNPKEDVKKLRALLKRRHTGNEAVLEAMTQNQIGGELGWDQSKVSRRIRAIFPGGMKGYKEIFGDKTDLPTGFFKSLGGGESILEGIDPKSMQEDD